jgi:pimeloyl-ACP methyl ester carboxylesterase
LALTCYEWGPSIAPPILLAHGGGDFGRTFEVLAPLLVAGGYRAVTWDQRGHGDSEAAYFYSWDADARDARAVLASVSDRPMPVLGHSKGGMVLTRLAVACPQLVSCLINIDGFPAPPTFRYGAGDEMIEFRISEMRRWLERRRMAGDNRPHASVAQLAARRGRNAQRLKASWLHHLVLIGAAESDRGWRWKVDPAMNQLLSNPIRLEWPLAGLASLTVPVLALVAGVRETLHMGGTPESVLDYLPPHARLEFFPDSGHFIHIEQPQRVADLVLDFLAEQGPAEPN